MTNIAEVKKVCEENVRKIFGEESIQYITMKKSVYGMLHLLKNDWNVNIFTCIFKKSNDKPLNLNST